MAQYSFSNRSRSEKPENNKLGNITLQIEEFNHAENSATGVTADGELMTIRLANKDEYADMFVNRSRVTTADARERVAAKQTRSRPDMEALEQKMKGDELGAIQFQQVKRLDDGELIAKWMESLTTTPDDTYLNAQVQIKIPRSNAETAGREPRRRVDIVVEDTAAPATMELLDTLTSNKIAGDDGRQLEGDIRSTVIVAVQAADDPSETPTAGVWTPWDAEAKSFVQGGKALFDRPLNPHNWEAMVPLAAAVGVPFEDLKFDNKVNATDRNENAPALYDATVGGHIKVAVAQGFTAEAMPRLRDKLVELEEDEHEADGRVAGMSDRGFFSADVSLRSRPGQEGYNAQSAVKQILPTEFLTPKKADSYAPRTLEAVGARIIAKAEANGSELTLSNSVSTEPSPKPEPSPAQKPQNAPSMTPSIS